MSDRNVTYSGIGLGGVIAAFMSWVVNKSFVWMIVHALFGWFYVLYACCEHTEKIDAAARRLANDGDR